MDAVGSDEHSSAVSDEQEANGTTRVLLKTW